MARPLQLALVSALAIAALTGCAAATPAAAPSSTPSETPAGIPVWAGWQPTASDSSLDLQSTDFVDEGEFPATIELTLKCGGPNISPELHWSGAPEGTKSFVITFSYAQAPTDRWLVFDIPADVSALPASATAPTVGALGLDSRSTAEFLGPCSLKGEKFRLWFTVYALDTTLGLPKASSVATVRAAGEGHVLAAAELAGYRTGPTN